MAEAPGFPVTQGFGFDWHAPETASCMSMADRQPISFEQCEFHASGAFGLSLAYHACPMEGGELLIFASAADCDEALATMEANAP
jgi:hypothetical protein